MARTPVHLFVHKEAARRVGLDLESLTSPYVLWNNKSLKQGLDYQVFSVTETFEGKERVTGSENYKKYEKDPNYVKIVMGMET